MKLLRTIAFITALLLTTMAFVWAPKAATAQSATGSISGHVLNGSAAGQPLGGASVTVSMLDGPNKRVVSTVSTDASGAYQIAGLQAGPGVGYVASVSYGGVTYTSPVAPLGSNKDAQANVTVYEAASDATAISVSRLSIVLAGIDRQSGLLTVVESYRIHNDSSSAYVGTAASGQQQSLQLPLFQGARGLTPLDGFSLDDVIQTARGVALTSPVPPGDSVVSYTYDVAFKSRTLALRRALAYPTNLVELLLPGSIQVSSPQLTDRGTVQLGGRSYDTIQATNLATNSPLVVDVAGLPVESGPPIDLDSQPVQIILMAIILAAIASAILFQRHRGRSVTVEKLRQERTALLREVAGLDSRVETGKLARSEHARRRQRLMAKLQAVDTLLRRQEPATDDAA